MAALEPSEDTLLILTSDHGNGLTGKGAAYEGGVRVPLIMRWPRHADRAAGSDLHIEPEPSPSPSPSPQPSPPRERHPRTSSRTRRR